MNPAEGENTHKPLDISDVSKELLIRTIRNEALLRTIVNAQAQILSNLENRDKAEVLESMNKYLRETNEKLLNVFGDKYEIEEEH